VDVIEAKMNATNKAREIQLLVDLFTKAPHIEMNLLRNRGSNVDSASAEKPVVGR